jgi:NADPH:quinone reductase-like Zn-dependent oxidoreductase
VRSVEKKGEMLQDVLDKVGPEIEAGKVKVIVDTILPLTEASKAYQILESNTHFGKILLTV